MKPNSRVKTYHLSDQTCKQIAILADEAGESATAIVEQAVNSFYQRDDISEDVILEKLSEIYQQIKKMDHKEEVFFSFSKFIIPYFIGALPDMLETETSFKMVTGKGNKNLKQLEILFQKYLEKNKYSFLKDIFADLRNPAS